MNAPPAQVTRPTPHTLDDEWTGLAGLLDLFSAEEPATGTPATVRPRPSLRASGARVVAWTRASSQRAASWGSGPQGAFRAW
ncbi:hypothetical protein [Blastococcus sp. SYSU D00695]